MIDNKVDKLVIMSSIGEIVVSQNSILGELQKQDSISNSRENCVY